MADDLWRLTTRGVMGVSGLLPFLKKAHKLVNIKQFAGCTVAIDTYCWLHKGAFACVEKLANNDKTDQYVRYCIKFVNQLLSFGIKPILVFDGCHLPSKKLVEESRRERRSQYRKKAAQFLREGKKAEARQCLERAIDVTPEMALEVMKEARKLGVDCIVAPYEADAQLAYLSKVGIAQLIITEDSDLILFGCEKILFKMDISGNGILIDKDDLCRATPIKESRYSFESFRNMCIMSGCDYLPSLPGIGLMRASKVFNITKHPDIRLVLKKLPLYLKNSSLVVPPEYIDGFVRAINTFLYQLVFDPIKRELVPLHSYPPEIDPVELAYAGPKLSHERALQIALGNINVNTGRVMDNFDPDNYQAPPAKSKSWNSNSNYKTTTPPLHMTSIWRAGYRPMPAGRASQDGDTSERRSTVGMEIVVNTSELRRKSPRKRKHNSHKSDDEAALTDHDLTSYYDPVVEKPEVNGYISDPSPSACHFQKFAHVAKKSKLNSDPEDSDGEMSFYPKQTTAKRSRLQDIFEAVDNSDASQGLEKCEMERTGDTEEKEHARFQELKLAESDQIAKAWLPPRNIFATYTKTKQKFDLNAKKEVTVEVKSRFFSNKVSPPSQQTTVTKCLESASPKGSLDEDAFDRYEKKLAQSRDSTSKRKRLIGGIGAFAWKVKSESSVMVAPQFDFKPVQSRIVGEKTTTSTPSINNNDVSSVCFKETIECIDEHRTRDNKSPGSAGNIGIETSRNTAVDASKENEHLDTFKQAAAVIEPLPDAVEEPPSESDQSQNSIGTYSFTLSQNVDSLSSQTSWKLSSSQQDMMIDKLEGEETGTLSQEQATQRVFLPADTQKSSLSSCRKLGMMAKTKSSNRTLSFYLRQSSCNSSGITGSGGDTCGGAGAGGGGGAGDDDDVQVIASNPAKAKTAENKGGQPKCRTIGLSKKRKSSENLHSGKQTTIKNFFAKFQHQRSSEFSQAKGQPLSPTKTNVVCDLTPENKSVCKQNSRNNVHRKIF